MKGEKAWVRLRTLLFAHIAENLVAVLLAVGLAADVYPVVTTVGGF